MRPVQTYFNTTLQIDAQWHSEPGTRGTFALLSSCLSTLFLCVWTAVHLNLPQYKRKHLQKWRKLQWLLIAAFAPEIVAWNAWEQRRQVKALTQAMHNLHRAHHNSHGSVKHYDWRNGLKSRWNDAWRLYWLSQAWVWMKHVWQEFLVCCLIRPGNLPEELATDLHHNVEQHGKAPHLWKDIHSWYAVMGGYVFELSSSNRVYLPRNHERMVLTPDGLRAFYKYWPHLMPEISQQDIKDKSKSDELAKFLTCLQAAWFCIQCIARFAQGLPVSLLEVNTLAHAVCSLASYAFWWNKPKDLVEPTRIIGDEADAVATLLYTQSKTGSANIIEENGRRSLIQARWLPCEPAADARRLPEASTIGIYRADNPTTPLVILANDRYWRLDFLQSGLHKRSLSVQVDRRTVSQLSIIQHHDELSEIDNGLVIITPCLGRFRLQKDLVVWRSRNFSVNMVELSWSAVERRGFWSSYWTYLAYIAGYSFASVLYAGLHLIAWNGPFPSELERTLWRISCVVIALEGFVAALWLFTWSVLSATIIELGEVGFTDWESWDNFRKVKIVAASAGVVLFGFCVAWPAWLGLHVYGLGRVYLVVECLREVFYLDSLVLQTTRWTQYIPHIA